jgi:hypothetical protein
MKALAALALTVSFVVVAIHAEPDGTGQHALERFLSNRPLLTSYRALRRLEASTLGGKMQASLEAWTYVDATGHFGFEVIREAGSGVIQDRVLRKALETEQQNFNNGEVGQVELTPANYNFKVGLASGDTVAIGLVPRRSSPMLLDGNVIVTRDEGEIVRIDGRLSESPSWWTRRVDIARRYASISGVRVPIEMSSRADVRVVGESTFRMTYTYTMINGRSVS